MCNNFFTHAHKWRGFEHSNVSIMCSMRGHGASLRLGSEDGTAPLTVHYLRDLSFWRAGCSVVSSNIQSQSASPVGK
jgi:hypothetical protein